MRLRSDIFVHAFLRLCSVHGAMALVAGKGDETAGAVFVKIVTGRGVARLYGPAAAGLEDASLDRPMVLMHDPADRDEPAVDAIITRQRSFDPDLWIVEVEHCRDVQPLHDWLVAGAEARRTSFSG